MVAVASRMTADEWRQDVAVVAGVVNGERVRLALSSGVELIAQRASSCLVAPEEGDRVLAASSGEEAYVLAVLRRAEGAPVRLIIGADAQVLVEGCLSVASRTLSLSSARAAIYLGQVDAGEGPASR
jgi:hypothetical protein